MHTRTHAHTQTRTRTHTRTHTYTPVAYQGNETEEKVFKKRKVFKEDVKELTGRMADRNRELVPDNEPGKRKSADHRTLFIRTLGCL